MRRGRGGCWKVWGWGIACTICRRRCRGEQQRVAIARALANRPPLLLADEPTGNLDERTGGEVMALLRALPAQGTAVVLVTHDLGLAAQADRVVQVADGRIAIGD